MNFLYPGFLFALLAVVIPIIIHLFNFRKFKKVYFSNVAFLKGIKAQNSSKEKLKEILILICRILAVIFLVLAFARPFLPSKNKIDQLKGNTVSIYIDNSYSMDAVNKEGSLLDEAKRKAKEVVKAFQINDRFQLLTNDFEGRHQRLLNADELKQAIDEVKISSATRTLQQVINRQQSIFIGTNNRFIYLISDFQKGFVGEDKLNLAEGTNASMVKLKATPLPNVAVDSVWLLSPVQQVNTAAKLVVQLRNYGNQDAKNIPIKLTINNQQKAVSNITIPAGKTILDTLSYSGLSNGWQKAIVQLKDFPITFDDELNFAFKVSANQQVLSINALNVGNYIKALYGADPYFKLTEMPENNINYAIFSNYSLIILNGLVNPSSGLAQELKNYVANGGSVVIFPNLTPNSSIYTSFLKALQLPAVAELKNTAIKVNSIELKHPLFKDVFETLPQNIDLPQVNNYFSYAGQNNANVENLMTLPANQLFFSRFLIGNGKVYLCATDLNPQHSNLATHPVFVPLMYKIAFSSIMQQPIYYTAMRDDVLESGKINLGQNQSLKLVAKQFEIIPEVRQSAGKTLLYVANEVKMPGFYELKKSDSTLAVMAFNQNRAESDMDYDTKGNLKTKFGANDVSVLDANESSVASAVAVKNNGIELWKLCLILTLVFIAAEIVLIRFYHLQNK